MENYMKNHFSFMGVRAPERRLAEKAMLQDSKDWSVATVIGEIKRYYQLNEREYQYVAADLLARTFKRLSYVELQSLFYLINEKSWWDSVDILRSSFSKWCLIHPDKFEDLFNYFTTSESFWDRRVALNLQLGFKEKTNHELLEQAILRDIDTNEFFIQKSIGWALRDYSKTNPTWVCNFLKKYPELSALAIREASKYL